MFGPLSERVKTDVRVPRALMPKIEAIAKSLGIPKNALFIFGIALLGLKLLPLLPSRTRKGLFSELKIIFQKAFERVENYL